MGHDCGRCELIVGAVRSDRTHDRRTRPTHRTLCIAPDAGSSVGAVRQGRRDVALRHPRQSPMPPHRGQCIVPGYPTPGYPTPGSTARSPTLPAATPDRSCGSWDPHIAKVKSVQSWGKSNHVITRRGAMTRSPPPSSTAHESGPGTYPESADLPKASASGAPLCQNLPSSQTLRRSTERGLKSERTLLVQYCFSGRGSVWRRCHDMRSKDARDHGCAHRPESGPLRWPPAWMFGPSSASQADGAHPTIAVNSVSR